MSRMSSVNPAPAYVALLHFADLYIAIRAMNEHGIEAVMEDGEVIAGHFRHFRAQKGCAEGGFCNRDVSSHSQDV